MLVQSADKKTPSDMTQHPSLGHAQEILRQVQNDCLKELLGYWISIHPRTRLPSREDFDPLDVPKALPHLVLTDVERNPYRFRIRLMGTSVVEAIGSDFTGGYLDEVWPGSEDQLIIRHRIAVAESGMPSYRYGVSPTPFRLDFAPLERIFLPFSSDGISVDKILSMVVYLQPEGEPTIEM